MDRVLLKWFEEYIRDRDIHNQVNGIDDTEVTLLRKIRDYVFIKLADDTVLQHVDK